MQTPKNAEDYTPKGRLIIIGGHEEKSSSKDRQILDDIAKYVGTGKLVVTTVASSKGDEVWQEYKKTFSSLGVKKLENLRVENRTEAFNKKALECLKDAKGIFFTGGDQLKITAELGGTDVCMSIHDIYARGGFIAGTSAGASVMSETMLISGPSDKTAKSLKSIMMAPGLGFIKEVVVDQHFSERGRISRLMAAVALNPRYLGIGIDEDTAIIVDKGLDFKVIGTGAVYVVDGRDLTNSNISTGTEKEALSVHNVRVHILNCGEKFDLIERQPILKRQRSTEANA